MLLLDNRHSSFVKVRHVVSVIIVRYSFVGIRFSSCIIMRRSSFIWVRNIKTPMVFIEYGRGKLADVGSAAAPAGFTLGDLGNYAPDHENPCGQAVWGINQITKENAFWI